MPGAKWRNHHSVQGGFRVDLPAAVKPNLPIPGLKRDPKMKVEGTMLLKRGELYAVMYWDVPPAAERKQTDEKLLDESVRGIEREPAVRNVVRQQAVVVSGRPGREIEYIATDGGTYICRVVVGEKRLYAAVGGGRFVRSDNANIRRFLDSFEVVAEPEELPPVRRRKNEKVKAR